MAQQNDPRVQIQALISQYNSNPDLFTPDEIEALRDAADQVGVEFSPGFDLGQAAKNFGWELLDSALLGLPTGVSKLTGLDLEPAQTSSYDDVAQVLGGLLGFAVPMGIGGKVASTAMKTAERVAGKGTKTIEGLAAKLSGKTTTKGEGILDPMFKVLGKESPAGKGTAKLREYVGKIGGGTTGQLADASLQSLSRLAMKFPNAAKGAIRGATAFGLSEVGADPLSAPGNAITGGIAGGIMGGIFPQVRALAKKLKISLPEAEKLLTAYMYYKRGGDIRTPGYDYTLDMQQ